MDQPARETMGKPDVVFPHPRYWTPAEMDRRRELWITAWDNHVASVPYKQFQAQIEEETKRLGKVPEDLLQVEPTGESYSKVAYEIVKTRWVEQGIWRKKWNGYWLEGLWKHEESDESESDESGSEPELGDTNSDVAHRPTAIEKQLIAERRAIRERRRELSRPFHQFISQVLQEQARIGERVSMDKFPNIPYISTTAYQNVKKTWIERGICSKAWRKLPGMLWKHEFPIFEISSDDSLSLLEDEFRVPASLFFHFKSDPIMFNAVLRDGKVVAFEPMQWDI